MSKKEKSILMIVFVLTLIIVCVSTTFAYFTNISISTTSEELEVTSAVTNTLIFDSGEPLRIDANEYNFLEQMNSLTSEGYASAILKVGTTNQESTFYYKLDLSIESNDLEYVTLNNKPELLLAVYDYKGDILKNATGLEYKEINGHKGFDITNKIGDFNIINNVEITSSTELEHKWKFVLTFVNYDENQDNNVGKEFKANIKIGAM